MMLSRCAWACVITSCLSNTYVACGQVVPCAISWQGHAKFFNDADIAVGANQVLVCDHDYLRVYTKCGQVLNFASQPQPPQPLPNGLPLNGEWTIPNQPVPVQGLFYSAGATENGQVVIGDPRVEYHRTNGRFYVLGGGGVQKIPNTNEYIHGVYLAISAFEDATQWPTKVFIPNAASIPTDDKFANMHLGNLSFDNSSMWLIQQDQVSPILKDWAVARFDKLNPAIGGVWTYPSAWQSIGGSPGSGPRLARRLAQDASPQYAVDIATTPTEGRRLRFFAISQGGVSPIDVSAPEYISIAQFGPGPSTYSQPLGGVPPSNHPLTNPNDFRVHWHAVYRDGYVWTVFVASDTSFALDSTVIRWYKVAMNGWTGGSSNLPTLDDSGVIDPKTAILPAKYRNAFAPTISVHAGGVAAISFNVVGPDAGEFIRVYTTVKCGASSFSTPVLRYNHNATVVGDGVHSHTDTDYAGLTIDPTVPSRFWLHHGIAGWSPADGTPFQIPSFVTRFNSPCGMDYTGDGLANGSDAAAFASLFGAGDEGADLIPDQQIDLGDAVEYQNSGLP